MFLFIICLPRPTLVVLTKAPSGPPLFLQAFLAYLSLSDLLSGYEVKIQNEALKKKLHSVFLAMNIGYSVSR